MTEPSPSADIELVVDRLAYEGAAVGRVDGRVFFVSGAAPGDRVRARVTRSRKRLVEARVVEVLEPGAARVSAPCPVADRCGGCDWQHVSYAAQVEAKRQIVIDALERLAKVSAPPVAAVRSSPLLYGYRNRIRLHYDGGKLCYFERHSRRPVAVSDCLIADDRVRAAMPATAALVASLETTILDVELASRVELPGVVVSLSSRGRLRPADNRALSRLTRDAGQPIAGVIMSGPRWHRAWGDTRRRFLVGEPPIAIDCIETAFGQVNTEANRILVEEVLACARPDPAETVWDLYAGAGNLSLPLARRAGRVVSVEHDPGAVAAARAAAADNGINNCAFHPVAVEDWLATAGDTPDLLVLNPPRSGLGETTAAVGAARARRIVYVSCNPATLARDVKILGENGYSVAEVRPIDLFPQTCRIETVCQLALT